MLLNFLHTSDIHLGKKYRSSADETERYKDFFHILGGIVSDTIIEQVDFVLIGGDLFHTGQIFQRTFTPALSKLSNL